MFAYPRGSGLVGETVSVRLITLTIVGFLLGALAAGGIGVRVIREVRALDDATSLPAQNIARADGYHVDPGETLISSVALVPDALTFGDNGLLISYDLTSLAPSLGVETPVVGQPLYPKRWLIEAIGGEFEGVQENPGETIALFPLLAGGSVDQIDEVRVVEAFVPAPFEVQVTVSAADPKASVVPGVEVELVDSTNDGDTTTIEVRIVAEDDGAVGVEIVGDGPGWFRASAGHDTVTLTREGDDGTAEFDLVVFGTSWIPVVGEFTVRVGAIDE
jgi:hypothetical protein